MTVSRKAARAPDAGSETSLAAHVQGRFEAEKARIARHLHGDVAGMLAAARMDLSRMAHAPGVDAELREQVARIDEILESVIQKARAEMQRLHPALLDHFGLSAALRHLVEHASRASGAQFTLELPDFADDHLSEAVALAAYRLLESLLQSRALVRVSVRLRQASSRLLLGVEVDGDDIPGLESRQDLLALRSWLTQLGATFKESRRGATTAIELELPRRQDTVTGVPAR